MTGEPDGATSSATSVGFARAVSEIQMVTRNSC